ARMEDAASDLDRLSEEIRAGRCVAFVGAGFSIPAFRKTWKDLVCSIAKNAPDVGEAVLPLLSSTAWTSADLEAAAQMLQDGLGDPELRRHLERELSLDGAPLPEAMRTRLDLMRTIPFEAVLTTNFDTLLVGSTPSPRAFADLLR